MLASPWPLHPLLLLYLLPTMYVSDMPLVLFAIQFWINVIFLFCRIEVPDRQFSFTKGFKLPLTGISVEHLSCARSAGVLTTSESRWTGGLSALPAKAILDSLRSRATQIVVTGCSLSFAAAARPIEDRLALAGSDTSA